MTSELLLENAERYVRTIFTTRVEEAISYHNIAHTVQVVQASLLMADYYQLPEEDRTALLLAAWFHDTGFSLGKAEGHEIESQQIAGNWLRGQQVEPAILEKVIGCIAVTRMPQKPVTLIEQILCDADLSHLGTAQFRSETKSLRREIKALSGEEINKKEWRKNNIRFLEQHSYFTEYGKRFLEPIKQQNLETMREKLEGTKKKKDAAPRSVQAETNEMSRLTTKSKVETESKDEAETQKKDKDKESKTERGIATMFRIMSDNHVSLSQMADSKANIMISVNTIVLSILVSVLFSKLQYYPQFILPTIILCTVSLLAIVFAILATRPNVNRGTFTHEDVQQKKINLLFFGNFFKMELPDYEWGMKEMMNDREYLYGSMIKDIYFLGKVLARKYKFLRIAYNIFMFGLVLSIIAFIIAFAVGGD